MKRKKRHLSAEFKARIATEALKGIRSVNDIAQENDVAPSQVSQWKKELESRMVELFESSNTSKKELKKLEVREAQMERKVGQLVLEKDFLLKKCEQLGIDVSEKL
ncbi:MAG: transposase [Rubritalea sp.]|uniref:transposase n=1 Tax=Rubritalea sp. TaxID=2109375 RepID=UPI003242F083